MEQEIPPKIKESTDRSDFQENRNKNKDNQKKVSRENSIEDGVFCPVAYKYLEKVEHDIRSSIEETGNIDNKAIYSIKDLLKKLENRLVLLEENKNTLNNFNNKEKIDKYLINNQIKLLNIGDLDFIEVFALFELIIQKNKLSPKEFYGLLNDSLSVKLKLAAIEIIPFIYENEGQEEAREVLKSIVINGDTKTQEYYYPKGRDRAFEIIDIYSDPFYQIGFSALSGIVKYGSVAERDLCEVFNKLTIKNKEFQRTKNEGLNDDLFEYNDDLLEYNEEDEWWHAFEDSEGDSNYYELSEEHDIYYYYNRYILESLESLGTDRTIKDIVDYVKKDDNSVYLYKHEILNIFQEISPDMGAKELLSAMKSNSSGQDFKKRAGKLLCRLEFGQIGISEDGVKYLERMYNLGELNNPDYFVQRLTAKGDVGVFDDKRVLQKYFNLGDLASEEEEIVPQIQDFTYETLFREKEGETIEERAEREKYLQEFKENYFGFYDDEFFKQTGIRFNNLDFKEQGWFLLAYKNADENKRKKFINFARQFGERGLVSFLSLEYNDNNGDKLLEINEKLDRSEVEKIFVRYIGIQANAQKLEETMGRSKFLEGREMSRNIKEKLRENIYDAIMSRATDILSTAYQIATTDKAEAMFYNGKIIKVAHIEEVIEAMDVYEDFLEKMKGFFADEGRYKFDYVSSSDHDGMQIFNFTISDETDGKQKYAAISLRGDGTNEHLDNFEYDGEARINFLFSDEHISSHINDKSRREATTFRLDRECLIFDESGENVISKDNTKKDGKLSFDFGSIYDDAGEENSVLGRVMAVGNYHNAQEEKKKPEYYHNKESFYQELGEADIFKEIVETVEDFIKSRYIQKAKEKNKKFV